MKPRIGRVGQLVVLVSAILMAAGCGGYTEVDQDISSGSGGGGTGVSSVSSSPAALNVGDFMMVEFNSASPSTIDFTGVADDAKFMLAVGSGSESGGSSISMQSSISLPDPLSYGKSMSVEPELGEDDGYGVGEVFSAWLRAGEVSLNQSEIPADEAYSANFKGMSLDAKAVGLGESETFRVLGSLTNTSSYVDVVGKVRCVGSSVVFYVDTSVSSEVLTQADIDVLCDEFDSNAGEMERFLGSSSDVDGDGKLHVLMTSQINKLGALGGGIITGYFYAADLYAQSRSNPVSNEREIIYTMVPDPSGEFGMQIDRDFAMDNLLPAVLPHELQHAISYNHHVMIEGGAPEENWLNEGMSHLIEDVMGWGVENPSRYSLYLASPSSYGIVTQYSPNLMERGGEYLFLRYLYEQSSDGKAFLGRMIQTYKRGVDNVLQAFQGDASMDEWHEMLARWSVALMMSDRGISRDSRYTYRDRVRNSATGNWEGVILDGDADDGRGTVLTGVNLNTYSGSNSANVDSSTAKYYNVSSVPDKIDLSGSSVSADYAVLVRYQ